jgi:hypothetical protein
VQVRSLLRWVSPVLGGLQTFIGVGALAGGLMLMLEPSGSGMGFPVELLQGSPFPDYRIPGAFLFAVNGLGSLAGAGLSFARHRHAGEAAAILGSILMAWIAIQVAIIGSLHWLHSLYFALGFGELALGLVVRRSRDSLGRRPV